MVDNAYGCAFTQSPPPPPRTHRTAPVRYFEGRGHRTLGHMRRLVLVEEAPHGDARKPMLRAEIPRPKVREHERDPATDRLLVVKDSLVTATLRPGQTLPS
jgi:hypothetical protein